MLVKKAVILAIVDGSVTQSSGSRVEAMAMTELWQAGVDFTVHAHRLFPD